MVEHGNTTKYGSLPLAPGEEGELLSAVDDLLDCQVFLPRYELPCPPPNLVRRFSLALRPSGGGEYAIPWEDLPDELVERAAGARNFASVYCYKHSLSYGAESGVDVMLERELLELYEEARPPNILNGSEYDLHDVYVCIEAMLVRQQERRERAHSITESAHPPSEYELQLLAALQLLAETISHL